MPDKVAQAGEGRGVGRVNVQIVGASGQREDRRDARRWVGVAIQRIVAALVGLAKHIARLRAQREADTVVAGLEIAEDIVAFAIGHRGADRCAAAVEQGHGHTCNAGLASVLDAIAVEVEPDEVTHRCERRDVACIQVGVHFSGSQRDGGGASGADIGIAVRGGRALGSGRQHITVLTGWEAHAVLAGLEIGEGVEALAIRHIGANGSAGAVVERDWHAHEAGFASVLNAIAVHVHPDEVADAGERAAVACVKIGNDLAFGERDVHCLARGGVWIAVESWITTLCRRGQHTGVWQRGRELHGIGAGLQANEDVGSGAIGGGSANRGAAAVQQRDGDSGNAGLAWILHAIAIQILEHEVTNAALWADIASVERVIVLASDQRDVRSDARGLVRIAVGGVVAQALRGQHVVAAVERGGELHGIGAGLQVHKAVVAGRIGRGGANGGAAAVEQGHDHVLNTGLTCILLTVAVAVVPDEVANGSEVRLVACVGGVHMLTCGQGYDRCAARARGRIAVSAVAGLVRIAEHQSAAKVGGEAQRVVAGLQVDEVEVACGIRGGGAHRSACIVIQGHQHALDARFASVLHAIAVEIAPDIVADAAIR